MWNNQKQQKAVFTYVKLTNLLSFKLDFQKVDKHEMCIYGINNVFCLLYFSFKFENLSHRAYVKEYRYMCMKT